MMLGTIVGGSGTVLGPIVGSVLFGLFGDVLRVAASRQFARSGKPGAVGYGLFLILVCCECRGALSVFGRGGGLDEAIFSQIDADR